MMTSQKATARAFSNIATIKYWGNIDESLRLPANGSISMNLDGVYTETSVEFRDDLAEDRASIDGKPVTGGPLERISRHLDHLRKLAQNQPGNWRAEVKSANNFPAGAGIASSASAFAALSLAAATALGLALTERELSSIARLGSGSASRSVPGGFVEWHVGATHAESFAESFAPPDHWQLTDLVAIVSRAHKATGSTEGHALAGTSPLQNARVAHAPERLARCKRAILDRDFEALAEVVELDSNIMHGIMMTGNPPLLYWQPETIGIMHLVRQLRTAGLAVCYTIDAGPNVHCLCAPNAVEQVKPKLLALPGILEVREAKPGGPAIVIK